LELPTVIKRKEVIAMATKPDKETLPMPGSPTCGSANVNTDSDVLVLYLDPKLTTGSA